MKYILIITDWVGKGAELKSVITKFNAHSVDILPAGVWAYGNWNSEDDRFPQTKFFPMHRVKYIDKIEGHEEKENNSKLTSNTQNH